MKKPTLGHSPIFFVFLLFLGIYFVPLQVGTLSQTAWAADQDLLIPVGQSTILVRPNIERVVVGSTTVADVAVISRSEFVIFAKGPGTTTVHIWANGKAETLLVRTVDDRGSEVPGTQTLVSPESKLTEVKTAIGIPTVEPVWAGNTLILKGTAATQRQSEEAALIAGAFAGKVINLLSITQPIQVVLQCKVVEVERNNTVDTGIDFSAPSDPEPTKLAFDGQSISLSGVLPGWADLAVGAKAEYGDNLLNLLASPTLVTMDGVEASVLVGGQVPVLTQSAQGLTVTYQKYGVSLYILPKVDAFGNVQMKLRPEVSTLDWANQVNGQPALKVKQVETSVTVVDGGTIVLGGLISNNDSKDITKIPWLGDIPIIGRLFRSEEFKKGSSECIIYITPKVIKGFGGYAPEGNKLIDVKAPVGK